MGLVFFNVFCAVDFGFLWLLLLVLGGFFSVFCRGFYFCCCFGEFWLIGYFLNEISRIGANASVSVTCCWY